MIVAPIFYVRVKPDFSLLFWMCCASSEYILLSTRFSGRIQSTNKNVLPMRLLYTIIIVQTQIQTKHGRSPRQSRAYIYESDQLKNNI